MGCVLVASAALFACGSDPSDVVVGVADDDTGVSELAADAATAVAADSPPQEMATTTTTENPVIAKPTATTVLEDFGYTAIDVLGQAGIGVGDWATLRPPSEADDECGEGMLAFVIDGEIVNIYDELAFSGGIRLFPGPKGQDAFVLNCEESVDRVLLQGSAVMPEQGWPELTEITLSSDTNPIWVDYLADFAWRGDLFSAWGTAIFGPPNGPELYVFDPVEASAELLIPRIGERLTLDDVRVDVLLPSGWEVQGRSTVQHPTSFSHVQIELLDGSVSDPLAEGDDLLSTDSVDVTLFLRSDQVETTINQQLTVTEWTFLSPDGIRVVRHVPVGDGTAVIEMFADSGDGAVDQDLPWLVLDTLRVFEN